MSEVIHLGLISHTNAGKTTLARTLLGRDVGEVRDAPHVTDLSEAYTLIETSEGDSLKLWDTPGFGDTARLVKRLKHAGNPLGWILTQVWDRYNDRPFWCSQQAVRTARDDADVILYLVNAAEDPGGAAYIRLEMEVLDWIGRPVIVLLNQTGPPRGREAEQAEEERWRSHLQAFGIVRAVLTLDAFARCWVQEGELLDAVRDALSAEIRPAFSRLSGAWRRKNIERFRASMTVLAAQLQSVASDRESIEAPSVSDRAREFLRSLISGSDAAAVDKVKAMAALAESLNDEIRAATDKL
ncbi:MAG TPA: GTPase domain-containing protein, partial [Burkholderiales bacterium]|nr:GTPase domain-containing protein [Burkholderiales bacterium]